jgi:hypothetical protein
MYRTGPGGGGISLQVGGTRSGVVGWWDGGKGGGGVCAPLSRDRIDCV